MINNDNFCIALINHLYGVMDELMKYGTITYKPNISKNNLSILLSKKKHNSLFVNSKKQGYKLDRYGLIKLSTNNND